MKKCIFPGSFNPITRGHIDIAKQALRMFDEVVVAVADITYKDKMASLADRIFLAKKSLAKCSRIQIIGYDIQTTDLVRELEIYNIIRGIRNDGDLAYEEKLKQIYKTAEPRVEIFYIRSNYNHISSTLVRTIAQEGGSLDEYVNQKILADIERLYGEHEN